MASKKTQEKKKVKYLIKVARRKTAFRESSAGSVFTAPWIYFGENYREVKKGFPITCYESKDGARKAIAKEKKRLIHERRAYKCAVIAFKSVKLPKAYKEFKNVGPSWLHANTNPLALGKMPVFEIVEVDSDKWEAFCGERGN